MFKRFLAAAIVVTGVLGAGVVAAPTSSAIDIPCQSEIASQCNTIKAEPLSKAVWRYVSLALTLLGAIAVIVVIIGGIMYTTSAGDSSKLTAAKNTILYAIIGVVVAFSAAAIISYVNGYFS